MRAMSAASQVRRTDYITIVYPHFKCNEQTWMNSIRHVLSTTIISAKYSALPGVRFGQFSIEA